MKMFKVYRVTPPEEYVKAGLAAAGLKRLYGRPVPDMEGVLFDDGSVAVRWMTTYASHVIWKDWETLYKVHIDPHQNYGTRVEWSPEFAMDGFDLYGEEE